MQRYRSCLIVLLGCILLVLLVFFGGRAYVHWHMAQVSHDLFTVAAQVGYTPDSLLRHEFRTRDFNIVFPWNTNCYTILYYTTTLTPVEFGERVVLALPETSGQGWSQPMFTSSLSVPGLRVDGVDVEATLMLPTSEKEKLTSYHWFADSNSKDTHLFFYETADLHVSLDYKGTPIHGNIVRMYKEGGAFPIWMNCPIKTTEIGAD